VLICISVLFFIIMCLKAVMTMNLLELRSQVCFCESSTRMSDLLRSLM
jgi:hypothetical protein